MYVWKEHAYARKIVRSALVFGEIADFDAKYSVFLLQIYGSFGGW